MEKILYDYFRSSAAYRVRIALNLKGIEVRQHSVNLKPGNDEQLSSDYRELNPQGRVPFYIERNVEKGDDFRLGQSPAILEYLEEKYPEPPLLPTDIHHKALVRQMAALIGCDIHPLNNLSVLKYLKANFQADAEAVNKWYCHWIAEGFSALEKLLVERGCNGNFCFGESPTMADLYLIPQMYNARRFEVPLNDYPTLVSIEENCLKIEAFKKAVPEAQADANL